MADSDVERMVSEVGEYALHGMLEDLINAPEQRIVGDDTAALSFGG